MSANTALGGVDARRERRDDVLHRTRATDPDGAAHPVVVVNLSPGGLMMRCDRDFAIGDWVQVRLPVVGTVRAEVRWALGGRIGCRFAAAVGAGNYALLIASVGRD